MLIKLYLAIALIFPSMCIASEIDCSKYIKNEDSQFADWYFAAFRDGRLAQAEDLMHPEVRKLFKEKALPLKDNWWQKLWQKVDKYNRKMVGCTSHSFNMSGMETRVVNVSYQWSSVDSYYLGNLSWREDGGQRMVESVSLNPTPGPLEKINEFSLTGKGFYQFLFLGFSLFNFAFVLLTLIVAVKTPIERRKWLWILFIVIGILQINLNWTTGDISILSQGSSGFAFKLFTLFVSSVGQSSQYSPWIVSTSIPLGAIIFLFRRKKLTKK